MGKRKRRNNRTKVQKPSPIDTSPKNIPDKPKGIIQNFIESYKWHIITAILTVISLVFGLPAFIDFLKSPKEKYNTETFIEGDLKPARIGNTSALSATGDLGDKFTINHTAYEHAPKIEGILLKRLKERGTVAVQCGNVMILTSSGALSNGLDILHINENDFYRATFDTTIKKNSQQSCVPNKIILGLHDNRLYVSVEFKDLKKEETIGNIEFNHWKLYKPNLFDFHNTDSTLQVIDKQNNVVFSVRYVSAGNCVLINGYLIGDESVYVMPRDMTLTSESQIYDTSARIFSSDTCVCIYKSDGDWKQKAQKAISKIKRINR